MGTEKKQLRIASVEQIELGQPHGVVKWARQAKLLRRVAEKRRWMELEESQSSDTCQALGEKNVDCDAQSM